jgi:hypothetical protein
MGNNLKELRLAFLLTPKELADRMGADLAQVERLEAAGQTLSEEWIEAVARALGVPASAVVDPSADIRAIVARTGKGALRPVTTCPIAARFAIQAMVAKLGGVKMALSLTEDELGRTVQNLINYVESGEEEEPEQRLNRLRLSLQIIVLTVLQSRGVDPGPRFADAMRRALEGAIALVQAFSELGPDENGAAG